MRAASIGVAIFAAYAGFALAEDAPLKVETQPAAATAAAGETATPAGLAALAAAIPAAADANATAVPADGFLARQEEGALLAGDLIGRPLFDAAGAELGTITDVLIDRDRSMTAVVLSIGGDAPDAKRVAIPFGSVGHVVTDDGEVRLVAGIEMAALEAAPAFEPLSEEARKDDNQDLTEGEETEAEGGSVPPVQ